MSEHARQLDSFTVRDPDTGEGCWVGVRVAGGRLLLAVSRESDGDAEVALGPAEAERLARALAAGAAEAGAAAAPRRPSGFDG